MTQNSPWQKAKNFYHLLQSVKANLKFGFPARGIKLIAVTGTDGKTTTTSLIYHILKQNNLKVGYISTIEARIGDKKLDTGLHVTTPDPWDVPMYLKLMQQAGIKLAVLEATSSGLQQNRLWGVSFDSATVTNIKYDHLDYHGNWENYAAAKFQAVKKLVKGGLAVLNKDDNNSANWLNTMLNNSRKKDEITINWYSKSDITNLSSTLNGMSFVYHGQSFEVPLIGNYNIENSLAAINICERYLDLKQIAAAIKSFPTPKGRMEVITRKPVTIIIDFAHTGHALEEALKAVAPLKSGSARLITVFGCAGKRDKSRRGMGEVSARLADITVLTAEDPRDEKLRDVNSEIFEHAKPQSAALVQRFPGHNDYEKQKNKLTEFRSKADQALADEEKPFFAFDEDSINSRYDAIDFAIGIANEGDIVFITGKAHEQSLCFGDTEYPWSEHDAVGRVLSDQQKQQRK
jgi:UDP-N-acetylmuramoyl-L-alanyl-D-glutamate--2,6-diaminopimelate ligase